MSIDEFRAASHTTAKKLSFAFIPIFVAWLVVFLIILLPHYRSESFSVSGLVVSLIAVSSLFVPLWLVSRSLARKHGLTCPHCSYWFIGTYAAAALRTRHCPRCKREMFTEAQPSDEPTGASPRRLS